MCLPLDDDALLCWLQRQVAVLEVWREALAMEPAPSPRTIQTVEGHYHWLTSQLADMADGSTRGAGASPRGSAHLH